MQHEMEYHKQRLKEYLDASGQIMSSTGEEHSKQVLFLLQAKQVLGVLAFGIVGAIPIFNPLSLNNAFVMAGGTVLLLLGLVGCFAPVSAAEKNVEHATRKLKDADKERMGIKKAFTELIENQSDEKERVLINAIGNANRKSLQRSSFSIASKSLLSYLTKTKFYLFLYTASIFALALGMVSEQLS